MGTYDAEAAAARAGVSAAEIERLSGLGIFEGEASGAYTDADVRRLLVIGALERSGLAVDDIARLLRSGSLSLDFIDVAGQRVFAALSDTTFAELSAQTGIAVELLLALRDATGGKRASPQDRVREDELRIVPLVRQQVELGFRPQSITRALRVSGDSLRRIAEAESEWWRAEIQEPMLAAGATAEEVGRRAAEVSPSLSLAVDQAIMAIYHAQQMHAWSANLVDGLTSALEQEGLLERERTHPAMCFLDMTGYTELTQERGDAAAAELVDRLRLIVQRMAVEHGGRPVKWLGDGVMLHFSDPADGILAALAMVTALADAGLAPAHVGLHAGPVVMQDGDYYGQTVNVAARIGDYARPGEVLVSRAIVDAGSTPLVTFDPIGPVELKGLSGPIELFAARRVDAAAR